MLKLFLGGKVIQDDPVAFSVNIDLCATEIFCHQAAIVQVESQGLPSMPAAEDQKRFVGGSAQNYQ